MAFLVMGVWMALAQDGYQKCGRDPGDDHPEKWQAESGPGQRTPKRTAVLQAEDQHQRAEQQHVQDELLRERLHGGGCMVDPQHCKSRLDHGPGKQHARDGEATEEKHVAVGPERIALRDDGTALWRNAFRTHLADGHDVSTAL